MRTPPIRKFWNVILAMWRPVLLGAVGIAIIFGLMGWRLTTLTPSLSQPEIDTYNSSRSLSAILENGVNAPYHLMVYISTKINNTALGLRVVNALIGTLAIASFYMVSTKLYKPTIAFATTGLFATTSLLLNISRQGTPLLMLLSLLAIIAVGYMVRFERQQALSWILLSIVLGLSLYVPGMAVFIVAAVIWQFGRVRKSFESLPPTLIIISSVIISLLVAPLVISVVRNPSIWRELLGLPNEFSSITNMGMEIVRAVGAIFIISPEQPVYWLGRQPVLDVFAGVLFVFGIASLIKHHKLDRLWILIGIFVISLLWIGLATNILYLVVMLPFLYIVIGFGLQALLGQWQRVFPRNPIARGVGLGLLMVAVLLSMNFQLQRYFVAWPHNEATKAAFSQKLPE